jgi:cold shock protein
LFNDEKDYGFISQPGGEDVFVHHSAIQMDGFRALMEGDRVEFEVQTRPLVCASQPKCFPPLASRRRNGSKGTHLGQRPKLR